MQKEGKGEKKLFPTLQLPNCFIKNNASRHGQIEAPDVRICHREKITAVMIEAKNIRGQPFCFLAEDEKIAWIEGRPGIGLCCLLAEKKEFCFCLGDKKLVKTVPVGDGDVLPVIKTGALQIAVVSAESEWTNQMEHRISRAAETGDTAGVGGDFRLHQDNVKGKRGQYRYSSLIFSSDCTTIRRT